VVPVLEDKYISPPRLVVALGVSKNTLDKVIVIEVLDTYPTPPFAFAVIGLILGEFVIEIVLAAVFDIQNSPPFPVVVDTPLFVI
jgi:hypothetical protein